MGIGHANLIAVILDLIESVFLLIAYVMVGVVTAARHFGTAKSVCYVRVLLPLGLLSAGIRAALDMRMHYFDRAIATIEGIIGAVEESLIEEDTMPRIASMVLADLYGYLTRAHLVRGQVDDAALAVIRANRCIGIERLAGLPDFDTQTAQIVKAAVAAGRMLGHPGSGAKTPDFSAAASHNKIKISRQPRRRSTTNSSSGTVIPFPRPS